MKGTTFTVRDFELRDATGIGFWTCERDGWEVSCSLADDPTTQPDGQSYFARVALFGADFGSADGATPDEAVALAFAKADLGIARIVAHAARGNVFKRDVLDDARQAMQVIALDCSTILSPKLSEDERAEISERIERSVQRLDLAVRVLIDAARPGDVDAWHASKRERTAEPAFIPSEPPPAAPLFTVSEDPNDYRYTLDAMRNANAGDAHVLAWLDAAKVGDVLDTMHGARVERVA